MEKIYTSVEQLIGKTPLVELTNIEKKYDWWVCKRQSGESYVG